MSEPRLPTEDLEAAKRLGNELSVPIPYAEHRDGSYLPRDVHGGLTKRELFAAMAMQAILTGAVTRGCPSNEWVDQDMAVKCADALLKELARG